MRKYIKKIKNPYVGFLYGLILGHALCIPLVIITVVMEIFSVLSTHPYISPDVIALKIFLPGVLCCAILPVIICTFIGKHNQSENRLKRELPIESRQLIKNSQKSFEEEESVVVTTQPTSNKQISITTPAFPCYKEAKLPNTGIELITFKPS